MAMVGAALFLNEVRFATALLVQYIGYLRPHKLLGMTEASLVPPTTGLSNVWGVLLAPESHGIRSKTQQFDESVTIDWVHLTALSRLLRRGKQSVRGENKLWGLVHKGYTALFTRMAEVIGVSALRPHPYAVRHAGASDDYLSGRRSLEQVRVRGRWKTDKSVRTYLKASRAMKREHEMARDTKDYGLHVLNHLNQALAGRWQVPAPPRLARLSLMAKRPPRTANRKS